MSKIGKQQIKIPGQVKINFEDDFLVVKGPKGELSMNVFDSISLKLNDDNYLLTKYKSNSRHLRE